MSYVFNPPAVVSVPVVGRAERFPVHRIYCVGRNYEEHAKEIGLERRCAQLARTRVCEAIGNARHHASPVPSRGRYFSGV